MKQMKIETLTLGDLETNCYLVWDEDTRDAYIIDPADSGDFISEKILQYKLNPLGILLTHAHFDHVLGLLDLKLNFHLPIYLHPADHFLFTQAEKSAQHWLKRTPPPLPAPDRELIPDQILNFGDSSLTVIPTPGHTPGSVCLYSPGILFSGDTLFRSGVGRTDFKYSSPDDLHASLKKLALLPPQTLVYSGHGEPTTIGQEFNTPDFGV